MREFIDNMYTQITEKPCFSNVEVLFSIIQIKNENIDIIDYKNTLYSDIKNFINNYLHSIENRDFGYDTISAEKIIKAISFENSLEAQIRLLEHSYRLLLKRYYDTEANTIKKHIYKTKIRKIYKEEKSLIGYIRILVNLTSYNLTSIFISLFILLLITSIILLPSRNEHFILFQIHYEHFSDNFYINHLLNIISKPLGLAENFKIIPINECGVIISIISILIYFTIIVNYLYKKLIEIIKYKA